MTIKPIETRYAGHRFRSRLEARWAVFFDTLGVRWEYEPQGYRIGPYPGQGTDVGTNLRERDYLPDFLLTDCGTWVEVKGSGDRLDRHLMEAAALALPEMPYRIEAGPRLMILGPIPDHRITGDWGWVGLTPEPGGDGRLDVFGGAFGFASYKKNLRPWCLGETSCADSYTAWSDPADWLVPDLDPDEGGPLFYDGAALAAYTAARSARFEHGESGA
jgi:hypothetical protein